ncbi:hypothetical protein ACI65C_006671 [Semiaphis heraclei]
MILNLSGLYNWTVNIPVSMDYFWKSENALYAIYKTWIVVHHSDDIWNCLSITRYGFTSFSNRHRRLLDRWRERLVWLTNIYSIFYLTMLIIYVATTLVISDDISPVKNYDGVISYYRQNAMDFYFIVSDKTYNENYYMFYFFEVLFYFLLTTLFLVFDILFVTLCFGICCQMQIICSSFESVGHKSLSVSPSIIIDNQAENKKISSNKHDLIYDELKTITMDHQAIMEKYEKFIFIFRRVMLLQIFISSISVIVLWFTFIMGFSDDDRFSASKVVLKNTFCSIPPISFQIFMVCYLFGKIHDQRDSIIFALYSSNWTEMDMKCKKFILLSMKLINANNKDLKFTRTKIVNLEMFFKTMSNCYTVISVLNIDHKHNFIEYLHWFLIKFSTYNKVQHRNNCKKLVKRDGETECLLCQLIIILNLQFIDLKTLRI